MTISEREKAFKELVFKELFPEDTLQEFYEYWTEPNKSNSKMRFELEKTWHLGRRLKRWQLIKDSRPDWTKKEVASVSKKLTKPPETELEKLEAFYTCYCLKPTSLKLSMFLQWYEFMKEENLLKVLGQEEKETLKLVYGKDGDKLKSAWVQKTFDHFMIINFQFKKKNLLKAV